ncbi:MAG: SDR family oxidoreductase [Alphaproteobacteria bacterium]|nr:SDR family oxidoreductase [Alphaproteobacteria bacterium]
MQGRICLVTGATSGIGKATAMALARLGAAVILVCRDAARGREVARDIRAATRSQAIDVLVADLSLQSEVRRLAADFARQHGRLDVLINNAGAMFPQRAESAEGIEMTLAVNHLAPFLLTNLLLDQLRAAGHGRVVNVNSDEHEKGRVDFDDLQMRRGYPRRGIGMRAYGNAKLANLLTTYELARRLRDSGVTANAVHPGYVATNILPFDKASGPVRMLKPFWHAARYVILSSEQGAATPVYLAASPDVGNLSGLYFQNRAPIASSAASRDPELQRRMWDISEQLTAG